MKPYKKIITVVCLVLVCFIVLFGYNVYNSNVNADTSKEVTFKFKNSLEQISLGKNVNFNSKLNKRNLDKDAKILWQSSDDSIAEVYGAGTVARLEKR